MKKKEAIVLKEKFDKDYMPLTRKVMENVEKYNINEKDFKCKELENNEIRRVFNFYDKEKIGFIKKSDVKFCFLDLKKTLFFKIKLN